MAKDGTEPQADTPQAPLSPKEIENQEGRLGWLLRKAKLNENATISKWFGSGKTEKSKSDKDAKSHNRRAFLGKAKKQAKTPVTFDDIITQNELDEEEEVLSEYEEESAKSAKVSPKAPPPQTPAPKVYYMPDVFQDILAGMVSSVVYQNVSLPFDVIKKKLQVEHLRHKIKQRREQKGRLLIWHVAQKIYEDQGLRGFWPFRRQLQLVGLCETITLFVTYETVCPILDKSVFEDRFLLSCFIAGACSGAAAMIFMHPFTQFLVRISAKNIIRAKFEHIGRISPHLVDPYNPYALYHGLFWNIMHHSPLYGFKFMFYNLFCVHLLEHHQEYHERDEIPTIDLMVAGAASGIATNVIMHPIDSIRIHLQESSLSRQNLKFYSSCRRFFQCVALLTKNNGMRSLYFGLAPTLIKAAVATATQFTVYDKVSCWLDVHFEG